MSCTMNHAITVTHFVICFICFKEDNFCVDPANQVKGGESETAQPPTPKPTPFPTARPTLPPTASPTRQPTASPTVSPSASPSAAPSYPVQSIQALGIVMALTDVEPLDEVAKAEWIDVTQDHLAEEVMNTIETTGARVKVNFISQNPPLVTSGLRRLQSRPQEVTFDADYSIEAETPVEDINMLLMGAFDSNAKKAIYMVKLKEMGNAAFQDVSFVSVNAATTIVLSTDGDEVIIVTNGESGSSVGMIVGVAVAGLVALMLGLALYVRYRRNKGTSA